MDDLTTAENRKSLEPSAWVDQHGDYLYRYAKSRLRDGDASEEVVQQSFLAALEHLDQFSGKGTERSWLLGILKRKIVDFIRQQMRTTPFSAEDGSDPAEAFFDQNGNWRPELRSSMLLPLDSLEREEFWQIFRECLESLPGRQAGVFALREMDDLSTEEICKELEISASNLWVLLHRARLRLAICMKNRWQQEQKSE
jgi:RNA polymerase sigma-70 factor (TIGR02943 family)